MVTFMVDLYHDGLFASNPLRYLAGEHRVIKDINFEGMTYDNVFLVMRRLVLEKSLSFLYVLPGVPMNIGLRPTCNNEQLNDFVQALFENDCHLDMYTEHQGYDVLKMINDDRHCEDKSDSDFEDVEKGDNLDDVKNIVDFQTKGDENVDIPKLSIDDPWLNKLVGKGRFVGEMEDPIPGLKGRFFVEQNNPDENFVEPKYKVQKDFQYLCFDPDTPWNECKPGLGMKFESPSQLKQCLANYGVIHGYQLWYMQNDTYTLLVKCGRDVSAGSSHKDLRKGSVGGSFDKGKGKLSKDRSEPSKVSQATKEIWRKKKLEEKENLKNAVDCPFRLWASWMRTEWIAEHYAREIIDNPWVSFNYMHNSIRSNFMINVSLGQYKRAKQATLFDHEGGLIDHYSKIWQYRQAVLDSNPGSTCHINLEEKDDGLTYFKRFYGLLEAVKIWLPDAEHRQCTRHIYADFKKKWSGLQFKRLFWKAAASSMNEQFLKVMEEIKALDDNAYTWLVDHDPNTWCRAYFEVDRSCAAFENRIFESFNSKILSARGKPIITMLEDIRVYRMQRVWFLNKTAMELNDSITPFAKRHLEFMKIRQRKWVVYASGFQEKKKAASEQPLPFRIYHKNKGRSERIANLQAKKFKFDANGTGTIPKKAFDVSD
nr:hypothetical protein [Tanacetum cinerariifolium]